MRVVLLLLVLVAAIGLAGCQRDAVPPLVEVTELAPRAIEVGDRLELRGAGFPQGRPARVTFDGVVHRAGEADASASIDADGVVASTERVEVVVNEALEERFCGPSDRAVHATFVGDVSVAFASKSPGAPPLVGVLRGITLDVRPVSVRVDVLKARADEGARVLAFLGLATGVPTARGLPIDEVKRGSIAEGAGIRTGDFLAAVDGVHVTGVEDVLPSSSRDARLTLRRVEEGIEETKVVPLTGYAGRRIPRELEPALIVIALALAALLLLVVPGPALLTRLEIGLASRLRTRSLAALVRGALGGRADAAAAVLTTALLATFAMGPHLLGPDLDGVVLLVGAMSLLVVSRASEARGFVASVRVSLASALCLAPMLIALVELVWLGGAVHLSELVRAQGGAPWQAAAAQKPAVLVVAVTYLAAIVSLLRAHVDGAAPTARTRIFERIGVLCACALAVAAFFGGWQLPGVPEARTTGLRALGAIVFVLKTWTVAGVVSAIAGLASTQRFADARRFALVKLGPTLAVAAILVVVARRMAPSAAVENAFGAAAFAATVLLVIRSAGRVRTALAGREPHASPFI